MLMFGEIFTEYRETITLAILVIFSVVWTNRVKIIRSRLLMI